MRRCERAGARQQTERCKKDEGAMQGERPSMNVLPARSQSLDPCGLYTHPAQLAYVRPDDRTMQCEKPTIEGGIGRLRASEGQPCKRCKEHEVEHAPHAFGVERYEYGYEYGEVVARDGRVAKLGDHAHEPRRRRRRRRRLRSWLPRPYHRRSPRRSQQRDRRCKPVFHFYWYSSLPLRCCHPHAVGSAESLQYGGPVEPLYDFMKSAKP